MSPALDKINAPDGPWQAIAVRDGITAEKAYTLILMWSWPVAWAIKPAFEQAKAGTEAWRQWVLSHPDVPTLSDWEAAVNKALEQDRGR